MYTKSYTLTKRQTIKLRKIFARLHNICPIMIETYLAVLLFLSSIDFNHVPFYLHRQSKQIQILPTLFVEVVTKLLIFYLVVKNSKYFTGEKCQILLFII